MTKRKLIPILVVLILLFIASQFNAFGSLAKLTGKLIETVKATITKVSKMLIVKEKNKEEIVEIQPQKQKTIPTLQKKSTSVVSPDNLMNPTKEKKLENDDWEDEMLFYPFSDNINDDFYKKPGYDDVEIEAPDDWDAFLESLTIEIFSLSDEDYSEYSDANGEEDLDSLLSSDELLSGLELWLNIDKKKSKETEDSIWESPLMDEFDEVMSDK
jgi:Sec-independent protein translocase protein TatA